MRPRRVGGLTRANGHEDVGDVASGQLEGPIQLAFTSVLERGLVTMHARTQAAGQDQAVQRRRGDRAGSGVCVATRHGVAFLT